jgi:hypothetical protein
VRFSHILALAAAQGSGGGHAPVTTKRIASREFGPGHNAATVAATSSGATVNRTVTCVNESGAPITRSSLVFAGWGVGVAGVVNIANDVPTTGVVEYPSGVQIGDYGTTNIPAGGGVESTEIDHVEIPDGATFRILLSNTLTNGQQYNGTYLGFCGVNSETTDLPRVAEAPYVIGDSIQTQNSSALMSAATGRCPLFQHSISGTNSLHYSATFAAKHVALASLMGITRFVSNFGINELGNGESAATISTRLAGMRTAALAEDIKFTNSTITPRVSATGRSLSVTSATAAGGVMSVQFAAGAAQYLEVSQAVTFAGAAQAAYNGTKFCLSVNVGADTATFNIPASAPGTTTGTITCLPWKASSTIGMQVVSLLQKPTLNDWIRANVDDPLEWADACEPSRNSGRWKAPGEDVRLQAHRDITVSAIINTSRFNYTSASGAFEANVPTGGVVQWITGANAGLTQTITSSGATDITVNAAPASLIAIGDTARVAAGNGYAVEDGIHPKVALGAFGAQRLLIDEAIEWLDALL